MRRVLVARGGEVSAFSGLGGSHERFVNLLAAGDIPISRLRSILLNHEVPSLESNHFSISNMA
ncbi:MAG: hypothetical protein ACPHBS_04305 [Candidatus Thalassarchaeaceae archaeon]